MRITPLAVFCHKLETDEDLYAAVTLQTGLTHSNKMAIDMCYIYCYAIRELIQHGNLKDAYTKTLEQCKPENKLGISDQIFRWFAEFEDTFYALPACDLKAIGHAKIPLV